MAAQLPSAAKSILGAIAPDLQNPSFDDLLLRVAKLKNVRSPDLAVEARAMLDMGRLLSLVKEVLPHGGFQLAVREIGMNTSTASRFMRAASRMEEHVPQDAMEQFLAIGKTGLLEVLAVNDEGLEALAISGEYCGLRLAELPGMTVMAIRQAVRSINEDDEQAHELMWRERMDAFCAGVFLVGDVVQARYSGRYGRAVKIYPDGSASVCWQDAEPQPEGMGHERMPPGLLYLVERAAAAAPAPEPEAHESDCWGRPIRHAIIGEPDAQTRPDPEQEPLPVDPARVMKHMEIAAILKAIAAKVPTAPASAPTQNPLPADPAARPENVICMQEARLRSSAMTAAELAARDPARLKAYCADLLPLLIENAGAADLETLAMVLEEMIADQVRARPLPDVVAARYAIYCRLWLEGGAK